MNILQVELAKIQKAAKRVAIKKFPEATGVVVELSSGLTKHHMSVTVWVNQDIIGHAFAIRAMSVKQVKANLHTLLRKN